MWKGVIGIVREIDLCEKVGATKSALAMSFVCIDTMAFLALPADRQTQGREDFIAWVDRYLRADPGQQYQYRGLDVYGARCAVLHVFGSESDFHDRNPDALMFGYHDGGMHAMDKSIDKRLVMIGTASFLDDVKRAVAAFAASCKMDSDLRGRVERRLPAVLATFPFEATGQSVSAAQIAPPQAT